MMNEKLINNLAYQRFLKSDLFKEFSILVSSGALVVCNDSAGKDSQAMRIILQTIVPNVLRLCVRFFALSECSILTQCLKAKTDAKPLL